MNEELRIKITAVVDQAEQAIGAVKNTMKQFGQQTDVAAVSQEKLSQKVKEQKAQISQLKKEYDKIVAAQGKESAAAVECARQIDVLSSGYAFNMAALKGASTTNGVFSASALGAADASKKMGAAASLSSEEFQGFMKSIRGATKAVDKEVEAASKQLMKLWTMIEKLHDEDLVLFDTEKDFKKLESQVEETEGAIREIFDAASDASVKVQKEVGKLNSKLKETGDVSQKSKEDIQAVEEASKGVANVANSAFRLLTTAIIGSTVALVGLGETTREYRTEQAKLTTAFEAAGSTAETAKTTYNDLYRVLGDTGQATEAANLLAKLTTDQKSLSEWTNIAQGVYATFGESLPVESLAEAANETAKSGELTGALADALVWAGVSEEEFADQLFWANSESEREKLIRNTLNGLYGEAAAGYEENAASVLAANEAQSKLNESMAAVGEAMEPINTMFKELGAEILADLAPYLQDFAENHFPKIAESLSGVGEIIGKILAFLVDNWKLVTTIAVVIGTISAALTVFSAVMAIVNAVMLASPITWIVLGVVAAITVLVAIIAAVIIYWDELKAVVSKAMDVIKNAVQKGIDFVVGLFNKIINFIKDNWQALLLMLVNPFAGGFKLLYDNCEGFRNFINNFVGKIKTAFTNLTNGIKEKFTKAADIVKSIIDKIKGFFKFEWSLPKLKVPKFSITPDGWKVGDLLKGVIPKLGITWNARGGVFDKPTLMGYGNSLQGIGEAGAEAVVPLENNLEWLDKLATMLGDKLGGNNNTPIILQVDGKTFAKTAINTINADTRQKGKLSLNIV
jgi:hypothetical protein